MMPPARRKPTVSLDLARAGALTLADLAALAHQQGCTVSLTFVPNRDQRRRTARTALLLSRALTTR